MGLENDQGGYSSFNPDYQKLVSAISIAARWDKDLDRETDWAPQRKAAQGRENRYLSALAVSFLKEQKADGVLTWMSKKQIAKTLWPVGNCGGNTR